jgi:hypothetical protein
MQRKRFGEKRKGGYVDMGKQVCSFRLTISFLGFTSERRISHLNMFAKSSKTTEI